VACGHSEQTIQFQAELKLACQDVSRSKANENNDPPFPSDHNICVATKIMSAPDTNKPTIYYSLKNLYLSPSSNTIITYCMQHSTNILCLIAWEDKGIKLHIDAVMLTFHFILLLFSKNFIWIVHSRKPLDSNYRTLTNPSFIISQTFRGQGATHYLLQNLDGHITFQMFLFSFMCHLQDFPDV
jgi:hypothetical protein